MLFIETDDLKPGMRLAKPIYSKTGVLLYDRNTKLTDKGISSIKNFNLIGLYILEPAEPAPPFTKEDLELEQFLTVSMFQTQDIMEALIHGKEAKELNRLAQNIIRRYGCLDHKMNFLQPLRSGSDYAYKHADSVAILTALLSHALRVPYADQVRYVTAALLYDIGYLFAAQTQDPKKDITGFDKKILQQARAQGAEKLKESANKDQIPEGSLSVITQMAISNMDPEGAQPSNIRWSRGTQILLVADAYDSLTAMSWGHKPISELSAVRLLQKHPRRYKPEIVNALISSVYLLPKGCCVDLSRREKGLVIEENPMNPLEPLVLKFTDNKIYDLSDPAVKEKLKIVDIMKTMDNRIKVDSDILEQFSADSRITAMTKRYRDAKKRAIEEQAKQPAEKKKTTRTISNEPIIARPIPENPLRAGAKKNTAVSAPIAPAKPHKKLL